MALSWSFRRQALYYGVALIVAVIVLLAGWKVFFTHVPTCSDGVKNGTELGVDCGGVCAPLCKDTARAPSVLWARSFQSAPSTYTAAAYLRNNNPGAGARSVRYSFRLLDSDNLLIVEREGVIDLPPITIIPIVEPNISAGNRTPVHTSFSFSDVPVWNKVTEELPVLHVIEQNLSSDASRLAVQVVNDSVQDTAHIVVEAVLFDSEGVARGASKTIVASLPHKSSQPIIFTWPGGIPDIVRAEITTIPSF